MGATPPNDDALTTAVRARALLVIEDDAPIRRALQNALSEVADRILEAATGREGIDLAAAERPELIILDLGLPDGRGIDVCHEIRSWSRVPIVVLSARHSDTEKVLLLNAGADDYVTKPFSTPEFVARVRAVLRRSRLARGQDGDAVVEAHGLVIDMARRRVTRGETVIRLTPIEWDILRTLVSNAGRTLTHQQIFDAVWGSAAGSPQQYLRVHVTNLRRKVEANPAQPELIVTEPGVGYRAEVPA
ncbi:MAG TPA: response regulator transcription factor [Gemmatimonadales bacterium]|nr:response regulator transcription factor [Gemmatimonadales bacterium]